MADKNLRELSYKIDFNINENGLDKALNVEKKIDDGFKGIGESIGKVDNTIGQMANAMNGADKGAKNVAEALSGVSNNAEKANIQSKGIADTLKNFGSNVLGGIKGVADQLLGISNNSNKASQGAKNVTDSFKNINSSGLSSYNQALDFAERKLEIIGSQYAQQYKIARDLYTQYNNSVSAIGREAEATQKLHQQLLTAQAKELQLEQAVEKAGTAFEKEQQKASGVTQELGKQSAGAKNLASEFSNSFSVIDKLKSSLMGLGLGIGAGAGIKTAISNYAAFEQQMAGVHATLGQVSNSDMTVLSNKAIEMSNTYGISSKDVAQGAENLASAGFEAKQILDSLEPSLLLATAGQINMSDATNDVSTAIRSFGLQTKDAQHVVDVYAKAAADTNAAMPDMAAAMVYAAQPAHAFNQSLEETAAALGVLANAGIKGSIGGTRIQEIFSRLIKPTDNVYKLMQDLGFNAIDPLTHKMKPLHTLIGDLQKSLEGLNPAQKNAALAEIFGQEALTGVLALMQAGPDQIDQLTKSFQKSDGASKEMANTMNNTLSGSLRKLMANTTNTTNQIVKDTGIGVWISNIADTITAKGPAITNELLYISKVIGDFIKPFKDNWKEVKPMLEGVLAGLLGFKIITGIIGGVSGLTKAFQGLSKTASFLGITASAGQIFLVVGAIATLIGVMVYFYNTNKDFKDGVNSTFEALGQLKDIIMDDIVPVVGTFLTGVFQTVSNVFKDVMQVVGGVIEVFQGITDFVVGVFTGDWSKAWTGIKEIFSGIFKTVDGIVKGFEDTAIGSLTTVIQTAQKAIDIFNQANGTKITGTGAAGETGGSALSGGTSAINNYLKREKLPTAALGGYATGTNNATPGIHLVGENGPELLSFEGGERVVPANITSSLLNQTASSNVGDVVNQYNEAVTDILPYFVQYGKDINTNMSTGIDQNAPIVATSTNNLTANTGAQLSNFAIGTYSYGTAVGNELSQGLSDSSANLASTVKTLTDKVIEQFKQGFGIHSPSRVMYQMGSYLMQGLVNGMTSKDMEGFIGNWIGSMTSAAGGAVSGNLSGWITTAMALTGVGPEWYAPLASIIEHESGGDPMSINLWDWNAQQGHPSKGLMQLIDENMSEHHLPGMTNIYDPVSNIAAGIRLIQHDYGSVYNVPGIRALSQGRPYVGYATGTDNAASGLHWVGENGPELVNFGGGETVLNNEDSMNLATSIPYGNSGATIENNISMPINIYESKDPKATALEVEKVLREKFGELLDREMATIAIQLGVESV